MPDIAVFLAITAEEESATAVFHALQRRRYESSSQLQKRNHVHKSALHPFLLSVDKAMQDFIEPRKPAFVFDTENSPNGLERLWIRFSVTDSGGKTWNATPIPPLNFMVSTNGGPHDFTHEMAAVATERNAKDIYSHVKRLANRRNQMLYAASNGIPHVEGAEEFLKYRKSVVVSHLIAYLLVDQSPTKQLFVEQALAAFLNVVCRLPEGAG